MNLGNLDLKDLQEALKKAQQLMSSCTTITSEPKVEILADSISKDKKRLTTFELTFWRPILPQLTRHRALSFSVRSSRATPSKDLIEEIRKSPWGPAVWSKNEKGMVAKECYCKEQTVDTLKTLWINIALAMCNYVEGLEGVHKQIVNRLLEPFSCTHVVVSGTEWNNFFKLRCADDAQPEIAELALAMRRAMAESTPTLLEEDQWHLPYISQKDLFEHDLAECCKISAARCARVSYHLYDGTTDPEKDLELYEKLKTHSHWGPMEHVATPAGDVYLVSNFKGWNQLRKFEEM